METEEFDKNILQFIASTDSVVTTVDDITLAMTNKFSRPFTKVSIWTALYRLEKQSKVLTYTDSGWVRVTLGEAESTADQGSKVTLQ